MREKIMEEKIDTAMDIIFKLRKQREFEDNCLIEALKIIPKKYSKKLLSKYVELCCENLNGQYN
jgi:hypothetical protein